MQIDGLRVRRELRRGIARAAARGALACGCGGGGRGLNARAGECSGTCEVAQCARGGGFRGGRRGRPERAGDRAADRTPERRGRVQQIARQM